MVTESGRLDYWRKYFRSANSDIFDVIEHAILVAASDRPKEFRLRRDQIAQKLFSCRLARCVSCDRVELQLPEEEEENDGFKGGGGGGGDGGCGGGGGGGGDGGEKKSKVNGITNELEGVNPVVSNSIYDEAEALTEEIEEESQIAGEVLRIKEILANKEDESDTLLFESLRRLQLMALSVETLKVTEIGKAVNGLRKHSLRQIRNLVRTLIEGWKVLVDEWVESVDAAASLTEGTPESVNPLLDKEVGLPSPPLDEGAFLATQTTMELSRFFDGMDDDGNLQNSGEFEKSQGNGRKPAMENHNNPTRKQQLPCQSTIPEDKDQMRKQEVFSKQTKAQEPIDKQTKAREPIDKRTKPQEPIDIRTKPQEPINKQTKSQEALNKQSRPQEEPNKQNKQSGTGFATGPGRPQKIMAENKAFSDTRLQPQQEPVGIQKMPPTGLQDKSKYSDEMSVRVKLEAAKRKLHEGYQQAENAKKQRTIQVMELCDIPKHGLNRRLPSLKQGNHNRHWANGRC